MGDKDSKKKPKFVHIEMNEDRRERPYCENKKKTKND